MFCSSWRFINEPSLPGALSPVTFLFLTDTPDTYVGQAGKMPTVNPGETALIFTVPFGSSLTNGHIFVGSALNVATDVAMSGDATIINTGAITLANTGVVAAVYGDATHVPQITVDSKGRITLAADIAITTMPALPTDQIFVGNALNVATAVPMSGDATIVATGALTLTDTGVVAAIYGDATHVGQFTVDSKGRITLAADVAIVGLMPVGINLQTLYNNSGTWTATSNIGACDWHGGIMNIAGTMDANADTRLTIQSWNGTNSLHCLYLKTKTTAPAYDALQVYNETIPGIVLRIDHLGNLTVSGQIVTTQNPQIDTTNAAVGKIWSCTDVDGNGDWMTATYSMPVGTNTDTLRHNGTDWVASTFLRNSSTQIDINGFSSSGLVNIIRTAWTAATEQSIIECKITNPLYSGHHGIYIHDGTATSAYGGYLCIATAIDGIRPLSTVATTVEAACFTSTSGDACRVESSSAKGLVAFSSSSDGIYGESTTGIGINAYSGSSYALKARSDSGLNIYSFKTGSASGNHIECYNTDLTANVFSVSLLGAVYCKGMQINTGSSQANNVLSSIDTAGNSIWKDYDSIWAWKNGAYASTSTWTYSGSSTDCNKMLLSLFTCTDSTGVTRRIGYVKSATESGGTVTVTVVTNTDLASGDKDFRIAPNRKLYDYLHLISVPGELVADASNSQGTWFLDLKLASYLLPVDSALRTAASGVGAACAWNVYANATNLFTSAVNMTTNATLNEQRPNTNTIAATDDVSMRITAVGGTTKPVDFQMKLYIVPQTLFTAI